MSGIVPPNPPGGELDVQGRERGDAGVAWVVRRRRVLILALATAGAAALGCLLWGTIQVILGAELGALIAFGLARLLGRETLRRWFGERIDAGLLGSQNALTVTVLVSRLMPFVSFDLISYAAGLSCLHFWRFALATLAGIIPASFLLAHFGTTAAEGDMQAATWAVLAIGLFTGAPLIWAAVRGWRRS